MESKIFEADNPCLLRSHELENRNRQHQIFIFLAKIIRIYMKNYLIGFFENLSFQSALRQTIWISRFENLFHAFKLFDSQSQEGKEALRGALHVSFYCCIIRSILKI